MSEPISTTPDRSSVDAFILSFCAAYEAWNDDALASAQNADEAALDAVDFAYRAFLTPFITPDTPVQLASFGSEAAFAPGRATIISMTEVADGLEATFTIKSTAGDWHDTFVAAMARTPVLALRQIWYCDPYPENGIERLPYL